MNKINTILFDLDGTLLNTDSLIIETYHYMFRTFRPDYKLTDEEALTFLGPPLKEIFPKYFKEDVSFLIETYRDFNLSKHLQYVHVYETVESTLKELKKRNYKTAVVTSKNRHGAIHGLDLFHLSPFIDFVVGLDNVNYHKPHPQSIFLALQRLQSLPTQAIMIGDSVSDILAGKNAGMQTCAVGWVTRNKKQLMETNPDLIIYRMDELLTYLEVN